MRSVDVKRELILDAALELFAERTFAGSPVPLIAARAGVGLGTIYRHFDSKEALVNDLYRCWKRAMAVEVLAQPAAGAGVRDRFFALWNGLARFAATHPSAFAFLEAHHHDAYLDDDSRAEARTLETHAVRFIRSSQRSGAMRAGPPTLLLALVMGAFRGLVRDCDLTRRSVQLAGEVAWSMLQPVPTTMETRRR